MSTKASFRRRQATQAVGPWSEWEWVVMLLCILLSLFLVCVVGVPVNGVP